MPCLCLVPAVSALHGNRPPVGLHLPACECVASPIHLQLSPGPLWVQPLSGATVALLEAPGLFL